MVDSVTFLESAGGDGSTVTGGADPTTGLANGGHRKRFVNALAQVVVVAQHVVDTAEDVNGDKLTAQQAVADAQGYAQDAAQTLQDTQATVASVGSMLGINFGSFSIVDGEMVVSHLTTTTPSLVDGDLILTYEGL